METFLIIGGIFCLLYAFYFWWVVVKYRATREEEQPETIGVLEPSDKDQ